MKTYLTGIKSTGLPHLGNLFGSIKPALEFSKNEEARFLYFIADYHSLTGTKNAKEYRQSVYEIAAAWLAFGLDPEKVIFYKQSDIPEIFELSWILACHTPKGDLNRAHAYKAIVQANEEKGSKDIDKGVNAGLFNYPVLMASDILLFDTNYVPVGKDQVQHVEMARSMAQRVNQYYGEVLLEPQEVLSSSGQYVPGLDGRKMSKSYDNSIPIFVPEKRLKKLINKIATDSKAPDEPKDPETSSLFDLYKCVSSEKEQDELRKRYQEGISWGEAKAVLFEKVNNYVKEPREKYNELMSDTSVIDKHLEEGAKKAQKIAREVMGRVRSKVIGF